MRWRFSRLWAVSLLLTVPALGFQGGHAWQILTIEGRRIPSKFRVSTGHLELLAAANGTLEPIPFQIDERDRNEQLALPNGPVPSQDESPGVFDDNDLLVFAARDLGERATTADAAEVEVADPLTGEKGWANLRIGTATSRSMRKDVIYDPATDAIRARRYLLAFGPHTTSYFAFVDAAGQAGTSSIA